MVEWMLKSNGRGALDEDAFVESNGVEEFIIGLLRWLMIYVKISSSGMLLPLATCLPRAVTLTITLTLRSLMPPLLTIDVCLDDISEPSPPLTISFIYSRLYLSTYTPCASQLV